MFFSEYSAVRWYFYEPYYKMTHVAVFGNNQKNHYKTKECGTVWERSKRSRGKLEGIRIYHRMRLIG